MTNKKISLEKMMQIHGYVAKKPPKEYSDSKFKLTAGLRYLGARRSVKSAHKFGNSFYTHQLGIPVGMLESVGKKKIRYVPVRHVFSKPNSVKARAYEKKQNKELSQFYAKTGPYAKKKSK